MTAKTVLLIDDSRVSRMMAKSVISKAFPDWTILEAGTGEEGIAIAAGRSDIDFMLVDVNMPGIGGVDAATQLHASHPNTVISLLTANIQDAIQQQARDIGVGFIAKPIKEEKILAFLTGGGGE